ncbi:MAG: pseudaminic acid synthase [Candidatus Omnitrophica bacterium]|nr:pseudaminic acid synthase [Candidatus Omnitrophota bacterium]MDD5352389.1 pseudaminic acid synthase [Candidatus Omnitrophota bacterium]MDD5549987.1 pseudaminic acid synthase [Candidatus Omnitrophota bacterium]
MNLFKSIDKKIIVVAEISANHSQSFKRAIALIKKAKECGADAVKFQAYTPETMTINVNSKYFRIKHPEWGGQTLYQLYKKAYTPWKWFKQLKKVADNLGIVFFATAFDKTAVDFLEELNVPCHKIASFELVDLPLIEYAAKTKKPLIISTGMASVAEIKQAIKTAKNAGAKDIMLLKCVSDYPAKPSEMNLKTIPHMKKMFNCPIGLSDHTLGIGVALASVSLGINLIEKHFTISRKIKTPDSFFSIEPKELKLLVEDVRVAEKALGKIHYGLTANERRNKVFRRSLFAVNDIKKGETLTESNVRSIRPAFGLSPYFLKKILGKEAKRDINLGEPIKLNSINL